MFKKGLILSSLVSTFAFSESRDIIALIDTGHSNKPELQQYYCDLASKDFTNTTTEDVHGHGTNMASIIATYIDPKKTCILSIKYYHKQAQLNEDAKFRQIVDNYSAYLLTLKPKYINISASGYTFYYQEFKALKLLIKQNTYVVVSAGNENLDLSKSCNVYPACYSIRNSHFKIVGGLPFGGNYNGPVNAKELFTQHIGNSFIMGTSGAAATHTGKLTRLVNP